jgi:acetyltransferase-like isoleucine patch superfamily enzyme
MYTIKEFGNDIIIGNGVWIGSNAAIIVPCVIGDNSVIAAASVVVNNVDKNCLVAGMPAKLIKMLKDE